MQYKVGVVNSIDLGLLAAIEQEYTSEDKFKKLEATLAEIESLDITAPNYEAEVKKLLKDYEEISKKYEEAFAEVAVTKIVARPKNASMHPGNSDRPLTTD